jgi:hypothetical protein
MNKTVFGSIVIVPVFDELFVTVTFETDALLFKRYSSVEPAPAFDGTVFGVELTVNCGPAILITDAIILLPS